MCHIFFIHSSVDGHLGCFHVLAVVNSAAVNTVVHDSFWIMVFSGYMPSSGIAGSYGSSIETINAGWKGCGEKGTLLRCWWECKLIQSLRRTVWRFLKEISLLKGPSNDLLYELLDSIFSIFQSYEKQDCFFIQFVFIEPILCAKPCVRH